MQCCESQLNPYDLEFKYRHFSVGFCFCSEVITNQKTAFLSYIKSVDCYLDILAVIPLEILALIWLPSGEQMNYVALFRVNRLLKLWKVIECYCGTDRIPSL